MRAGLILQAMIAAGLALAPMTNVGPNSAEVDVPSSGMNCLFAFLRLHGAKVSYHDLRARLLLNGRPTTIADLAEAARAYGVNAEVRRIRPEEIHNLCMPAILHLELADDGASGYFVTAYNCSLTGTPSVSAIDGDSFSLVQWDMDQFSKRFSGYVLYAQPRAGFVLALSYGEVALISLGAALSFAAALFAAHGRSRST